MARSASALALISTNPKPSRLPGVTVCHNADALDSAVCFKERPNRILGSSKIEVSYKNILHFPFPFDLQIGKSGRFERGRTGRTNAKMPKQLRLLQCSTEAAEAQENFHPAGYKEINFIGRRRRPAKGAAAPSVRSSNSAAALLFRAATEKLGGPLHPTGLCDGLET